MELSVRKEKGVIIFDLSGRLELEFMAPAESRIYGLIDKDPEGNFLFNFNKAEYISSSFLKVIITTARKVAEASGEIKLCCMDTPVKRIFDIVNIDEIVEVFETEDEALRSFAV